MLVGVFSGYEKNYLKAKVDTETSVLASVLFVDDIIVSKRLKMGSKISQMTEKPDKRQSDTNGNTNGVKNGKIQEHRGEKSNGFRNKENVTPAKVTSKNTQKSDSPDGNNINLEEIFRNKIKIVFMKIDQDGNGYITLDEFSGFVVGLGLKLTSTETRSLFLTIAKSSSDGMTYNEFYEYFSEVVVDESAGGTNEGKLRAAFLAADRDGTGTLNFKNFVQYSWEKKRSVRISRVLAAFNKMDKECKGEVSYDQFSSFFQRQCSIPPPIEEEQLFEEDDTKLDDLQKQLKQVYSETDGTELAQYIRKRWDKFATFKRCGKSGDVVMTGEHGMVADIVPGEYSLIDLACFSDLPPLIPKHIVIRDVLWQSSDIPSKSGKAVFPADFNERVPIEVATNEYLRYYDCSLADSQQVKISLLYRHGIQDFTYQNRYLEDYVLNTNGGAGLEKHDFSHIDCPLEDDSGVFILAKFEENELHVTAFKVPPRYTLYVPGGTIHSNDYMKGTWRTMLSDETDIDHVHLVKTCSKKKSEGFEHFKFTF